MLIAPGASQKPNKWLLGVDSGRRMIQSLELELDHVNRRGGQWLFVLWDELMTTWMLSAS
jgi:hypothetical protein